MTDAFGIIPRPQNIHPREGQFAIPLRFHIAAHPELDFEGGYLQDNLQNEMDIPVHLNDPSAPATISLDLETGSTVTRESYRLAIDPQHITIRAGDKSGIADCLDGLASVAGAREQPAIAARVFGAAQALRERIGAPLPPAGRNPGGGRQSGSRRPGWVITILETRQRSAR